MRLCTQAGVAYALPHSALDRHHPLAGSKRCSCRHHRRAQRHRYRADDGQCALREALENANSDSQNGSTSAGECAAGNGADQISIGVGAGGPAQIISLTEGEMLISSSVSINGPGRDLLTIDANAGSRHFLIDDGQSGQFQDVAVSNLRLVNGYSGDGGAIKNRENLSLTGMTLEGNTAATESQRGGGLESVTNGGPSYVLLDDVRMIGNQAQRGGGALIESRVAGTVEIANSVIAGNLATGHGGGLSVLVQAESSFKLRDSSISDNRVQGPNNCTAGGLRIGANDDVNVVLERVQISGNTAGLGGCDSARVGGADIERPVADDLRLADRRQHRQWIDRSANAR